MSNNKSKCDPAVRRIMFEVIAHIIKSSVSYIRVIDNDAMEARILTSDGVIVVTCRKEVTPK